MYSQGLPQDWTSFPSLVKIVQLTHICEVFPDKIYFILYTIFSVDLVSLLSRFESISGMYSSLCSLLHPIMEEKYGTVCYEYKRCYSVSKSYPTLWPHGLQHARLPYPSLSLRVFSDSCPLSQWCYLNISSATPFSFCLPSFPSSGSFPISRLFTSGGHSIGASASATVFSMNIQGWFPLGNQWFDLLAVQETLKSLLQHHSSKASFLLCSAFFMVQLSHLYLILEKP